MPPDLPCLISCSRTLVPVSESRTTGLSEGYRSEELDSYLEGWDGYRHDPA